MEEKREGSRSLSQQEEDALQSIARSDLGGLFKARMDEGFTLLYANDSYYAIHGYTRGQLEQEIWCLTKLTPVFRVLPLSA